MIYMFHKKTSTWSWYLHAQVAHVGHNQTCRRLRSPWAQLWSKQQTNNYDCKYLFICFVLQTIVRQNHRTWTHLNGGNRSWPAQPAVRSQTSPSLEGRWWFCWRPSLRAHCYRLKGKMDKVTTCVQRPDFSGILYQGSSVPKSWKHKQEGKRLLTKVG